MKYLLLNWLAFRPGPYFFLKTDADGVRHVSWRVWVLVWVTPVLFALATAALALNVLRIQAGTEIATGTVVKVYDWENTAPQIFYPGERVYGPVFSYTWSDGSVVQASAGTSHTAWNFPIGTERKIRFWPDRKDNVTLVGPIEWYLPKVIAIITGLVLLPALLVSYLLMRWRRRGAAPKAGISARKGA